MYIYSLTHTDIIICDEIWVKNSLFSYISGFKQKSQKCINEATIIINHLRT